jgi:hypothetical protein
VFDVVQLHHDLIKNLDTAGELRIRPDASGSGLEAVLTER